MVRTRGGNSQANAEEFIDRSVTISGAVPLFDAQTLLNRTGFIGGLIPREDGAHGTTE